MNLTEGNRIKNILTGKFYEVKRIDKEWVLLHSEDGRSQVLTGRIGVEFIYVREGIEEGPLRRPIPEVPLHWSQNLSGAGPPASWAGQAGIPN